MTNPFKIAALRVYVVPPKSTGGDYFNQAAGHWLIDSLIANPMSGYAEYRDRRTSWGISVLGSIADEIETESGAEGVAAGSGGMPAAWLIHNHFRRFVVGEDARNINKIWDELFRASLPPMPARACRSWR